MQQLKPEILVCKMSALLIDAAAAELEKHRKSWKELLSLSMLMKAIFIQCFSAP